MFGYCGVIRDVTIDAMYRNMYDIQRIRDTKLRATPVIAILASDSMLTSLRFFFVMLKHIYIGEVRNSYSEIPCTSRKNFIDLYVESLFFISWLFPRGNDVFFHCELEESNAFVSNIWSIFYITYVTILINRN